MRLVYSLTLLLCMLCITTLAIGQETLRVEIATYLVPSTNTDNEKCIQLLDSGGQNYSVITLDGIKAFEAQEKFEYVLDVAAPTQSDTNNPFTLNKEVSKMWVPQYGVDAPVLDGSYQVVGVNGQAIDGTDINLIINTSNRVKRGSTGCNNYNLFFEQHGYNLIFSKILASHMFCASRAALEEQYFVAFNSVDHFEADV